MAQRKGRGRSGGAGFKGFFATGLVLLLIASGITAIVRNNNINSVPDAYEYFKSWSDKAWECGAGDVDWKCDTSGKKKDKDSQVSGKVASSTKKDKSLATLDKITVKDREKVEYKRSEWKHWTGSPCNTREKVLKEQGKNVKTDKECRALSGTWVDPYSGDKFDNASKLDIDHVIPLSAAAQSGGQKWSKEKKEKFANDTSQLLAVSAKENRKKSDDGPGKYMPPNRDFRCDYAKLWVDTASKYDLTIDKADKRALTSALNKCSS